MPNLVVLTLDSIGAYGAAINLDCQKGIEADPRLVGDETPAYRGGLRASVLAEKRVWNATTARVSTTVKNAVKALIAKRRQIYCSGELFANVATLCSIQCTSAEMQEGTVEWVLQLILREV
jgi:hypothetical protein